MSYHQGLYKPIYPQKYEGDSSRIIFRSSWERKFMYWCDHNPSVLKWSSEEIVIPYKCPTDNKWHRYFVDFKIKVRTNTGSTKTYLVEIKPAKETRPPTAPEGKKTKRYLTEVLTWGKNEAKWKAAKQYAADRGQEFVIITERELFGYK